MSEGTTARITRVTIGTGDEERAITVPQGAGTPQSVKVELAGGKTVTVNADGGLGLEDGRTVSVDADGEIRVTGKRKAPAAGRGGYDARIGPGARGVQLGDGNTQVNAW